ncbi:MAG: response regulator [Victivallales bacterium]
MNIKNIRISTQLKLGFAAILLFVVVLGAVSYMHSHEISRQSEVMYKHPLKVRTGIGKLRADILSMCLATRDLMLAKNDQERQTAIQLIELSDSDAIRQFGVLNEHYLGPRRDIEEAHRAFVRWKTARGDNIKLALSGEIEKVKENIGPSGTVGRYRDKMLDEIQDIESFAERKADILYFNARQLRDSLSGQLILLVAAILILSLIIVYVVLRNIRKPLDELIAVARRFRKGDMAARSSYELHNEFGILTDSFNALAESIQRKTELDEKVAGLSALMLSEYDAKKFFQATLNALATQTGSQMAAIYILSEDRKSYKHFESIGADENARRSFSAESFEGEFGSVISSRKVQWIKSIPEDTRFVFNTVGGKFIPREIITIPILAGKDVTAIISLASVSSYSYQSVQLIDRILVTLCARVEGIMAYRRIKEFSEKLEFQNRELEVQKTELSSQSAELTEQNTELEMQTKQLDEASRLKTNFLSNMSHELRTPLNSVIALSGVLNRRLANQIPAEEYSYLEVIERNGRHLLSLINDVLDISRIEAGREEIEIAKFNANSLIAELVAMIHPQAKHKNIELLQNGGDSELFITSDAHKCRHILQNIIGNAVKFTEMGKVEVTARQSDSSIAITVKDSGIGIDEEHIPHIFDEFRQADSSTSRRFGGTGLGLAIAKKYANLLGGTISVKSIPGKGSEFTLVLPLTYASENRIIEENPERHQLGGIGTHEAGREDEDCQQVATERHQLGGIGTREAGREDEDCRQVAGGPIRKDKDCRQVATERHQLGGIGTHGAGGKDKDCRQVAGGPVRNGGTVKTILLVEDSEPAIIQIKDFLGESGYRILLARNGGEALGIIAKTVPDAMILDLMMPGIDGFEVLKTVREAERTAHIPVLILTAKHISKEELKFLKSNNIHQLIQKGAVKREELLAAVAQMVHPKAEADKAGSRRKFKSCQGKPLVLVIEDNPDNMLTVKALLSDDYSVIGACDGNEGVDMARRHEPNLVLMDIALPQMDGIEAFKAIREDMKLQHIPVIALTASAMTHDRETILGYGFDAYIAKPIERKSFFKTINEVLYGN